MISNIFKSILPLMLLLIFLPTKTFAFNMDSYDLASLYHMADVVVYVDEKGLEKKEYDYRANLKVLKVYKGNVSVGQELPVLISGFVRYLDQNWQQMTPEQCEKWKKRNPNEVCSPQAIKGIQVPNPIDMTPGTALMFLKWYDQTNVSYQINAYLPVENGIKLVRDESIYGYVQRDSPGPYLPYFILSPEYFNLSEGERYDFNMLEKDLAIGIEKVNQFKKFYVSRNIAQLTEYALVDVNEIREKSVFPIESIRLISKFMDSKDLNNLLKRCAQWCDLDTDQKCEKKCDWDVVDHIKNVLEESPEVKDGVRKVFYKNGNIKTEYPLLNNTVTGVVKFYCEDGNLCYETEYVNDIPNGKEIHYSYRGKSIYKDSEFMMKDGKPTVERTGFFDNGNFQFEYTLDEDGHEMEGKVYKRNGQLDKIYKYTKGKLIKETYYYENGYPSEERVYGDTVEKTYNVKGQMIKESINEIKRETHYDDYGYVSDDMVREGNRAEQTYFYQNGRPKSKIVSIDDRVVESSNYDREGHLIFGESKQ